MPPLPVLWWHDIIDFIHDNLQPWRACNFMILYATNLFLLYYIFVLFLLPPCPFFVHIYHSFPPHFVLLFYSCSQPYIYCSFLFATFWICSIKSNNKRKTSWLADNLNLDCSVASWQGMFKGIYSFFQWILVCDERFDIDDLLCQHIDRALVSIVCGQSCAVCHNKSSCMHQNNSLRLQRIKWVYRNLELVILQLTLQ